MTAWLPLGRAHPLPDPDHTTLFDPRRDLETVRRRWEVRTAQWRAAALAESVFGRPVGVRLQGGGSPRLDSRGLPAFRGLLHLEVPFDDLELHRWREGVFRACASEDDVLCRVPLVYVFSPVPAPAP